MLLSCPLLPHGSVIDCSHRMMRLSNDQEASTPNPSYPSFINFIFSELFVVKSFVLNNNMVRARSVRDTRLNANKQTSKDLGVIYQPPGTTSLELELVVEQDAHRSNSQIIRALCNVW
jgi:hypothetical protein